MNKTKVTAKRVAFRVLIILLAVTSIAFSASALFMYLQFDKVKINKISKNDKDLGITPIQMEQEEKISHVAEQDITSRAKEIEKVTPIKNEKQINEVPIKGNVEIQTKPPAAKVEKKSKAKYSNQSQITNIALFGIDTRNEKYEAVHSDTIMILSIDRSHKKIKISSIMRDTYVNIDGHGKARINAAYMFGGPQLAIKTINKNFNMNIRDYYTVNFSGLSDIIDEVGGVNINVKKSEINEINKYVREISKIKKMEPTLVKMPGLQRLNGMQAVAYARIRKVGNGDFDRTERQKTVLTAMITKIQNQGAGKFPYIISRMLPYVETSMSKGDIIKTGVDAFSAGISNVEWCRFPVDGYYSGKTINKAWYLVTDINATRKHLHRFIYEDVNPVKK